MATTQGSGQYNNDRIFIYTWSAVPNGNQGNWVDVSFAGDISVQVRGTFGAGGSINIEGNNDGATAQVLSDPLGNALTLTAAAMKTVGQLPKQIRPNVTAGDGTTALTVVMVVRPVGN